MGSARTSEEKRAKEDGTRERENKREERLNIVCSRSTLSLLPLLLLLLATLLLLRWVARCCTSSWSSHPAATWTGASSSRMVRALINSLGCARTCLGVRALGCAPRASRLLTSPPALVALVCLMPGRLFPETLVLEWFVQICLAVKHIHDRKIMSVRTGTRANVHAAAAAASADSRICADPVLALNSLLFSLSQPSRPQV